jgi:hypothetical protein
MKITVVCIAVALMLALACADTLNVGQGVTSLGNSGTFAAKVANLFSGNGLNYNWVKVSLVLVVISILINGLIYMVARTFQITYLESAFKLETREAFFNIIIILLFGAFSLFLDNLLAAPLLCDKPENCIVNTSVKYMDGLLSGASSEMSTLEKDALSKVSDFSGSMNIGGSLGFAGLTVGYTYDMQGLNKIKTLEDDEKIGLYRSAAMNLIIVKVFLLYFAYYIGPMLIVFGIMLKCFSVTRRLGSTMLAIGVSCAIVLPLTIITVLIANGAISIPGVQYMKPAGCPDACMKSIIGWNSAGGIDLTEYLNKAQADKSLQWANVRAIVTGTRDSLTVSGLGKVYSCEFKNIAINTTTIAAYKAAPISINFDLVNENATITTECPANCRSIPYPSDVSECRDAEKPCATLYAASNPSGACFRNNYDYTNLNYPIVYDGAPMNLGLALSKSSCFRVTPLAITPKDNPLDYCPSSCRFFYSNGSTGCETIDPNYYNCSKVYTKAIAGATSAADAGTKAKTIYQQINNSLATATPNTGIITTQAQKASLPIFEVNNPNCLKIMKIPQDIKSVPTYIDCNGCYNTETHKAGAKTAEGKFMAYSIMLGIFSIAITIAAAVAISMGLEGEMFIPGIERLRR